MLNKYNRNMAFLRFIEGEGQGGGTASTATPSETPPAVAEETPQTFTADALQKAREQEKNKLYPEIERLKRESAEKDQRLAAFEQAKAEALKAQTAQEESQMDFHELLQKKEAEWNARLAEEQRQREEAFAMLQREREYQDLQNYLQSRLAEVGDQIIPDLRDLVGGSSTEEIDASVASMVQRSAAIVQGAQAAMQQTRQGMSGTRVTTPAAGPLDTDPAQRTYSDDDVRQMSMADYIKNRSRLMRGGSRGTGLFG